MILGVSCTADEAEVRARYLELVKQFPPEREPEKFREIRSAFEAAKDPLAIAWRLTMPPAEEVPTWDGVLAEQRRNRPRMSPAFLLSLGNRAPGTTTTAPSQSQSNAENSEAAT